MGKQNKKRKVSRQPKITRNELRESVPFMELNRKNRRAMAKSRKLFKGDDRSAWQMLTHREESNDV